MFVEILPNVMPPILVETTVRLGYAIFAVATLSFIGFRHPAAVARLGPVDLASYGMSAAASGGRCCSRRSPSPRLVIGVNLVADGVQQALDAD